MKVKFRRPYFSKEGVTYPSRQIVEVPDDTALPSDAEKITNLPKGFEIPPDAPPTLPGYGGKPLHHEAMAQVGAEPTHLITEASGVSPGAASGAVMTDKSLPKGEVAEPVTANNKVVSAKDDKSSKSAKVDL
jgi:hypothetical protein